MFFFPGKISIFFDKEIEKFLEIFFLFFLAEVELILLFFWVQFRHNLDIKKKKKKKNH
jgi:hypothetical protein